jgi:hypothetical protein
MPNSAQNFFNQILKIASFDIVNLEPYLNKFLNLKESESLNPNFNALGFDSIYFLNNMNSMVIGFMSYFIMILLLLLLDPFQSCSRKISSITEPIRKLLFYNFII